MLKKSGSVIFNICFIGNYTLQHIGVISRLARKLGRRICVGEETSRATVHHLKHIDTDCTAYALDGSLGRSRDGSDESGVVLAVLNRSEGEAGRMADSGPKLFGNLLKRIQAGNLATDFFQPFFHALA